jgi:photosystem II stability/assembly factor-like uncharacterized protein
VSHNGGRTWSRSRVPGQVLNVATAPGSVWLLTATKCRSAKAAGVPECRLGLLISRNGGRSWRPSAAPLAARAFAATGAASASLVRAGAGTGYVLGTPGPSAVPLWITRDGGRSWTRRSVPCLRGAQYAELAAARRGVLTVACAGQPSAGFQPKSVARSVTGGRSWTVSVSCPGAGRCASPDLDEGYLGSVAAVSDRTVFLVGDRSSLLVTRDGGRHWTRVRTAGGDTSGGTFEIQFLNGRVGFVLGDSPATEAQTIWRTTDGGIRWSGVVPRR